MMFARKTPHNTSSKRATPEGPAPKNEHRHRWPFSVFAILRRRQSARARRLSMASLVLLALVALPISFGLTHQTANQNIDLAASTRCTKPAHHSKSASAQSAREQRNRTRDCRRSQRTAKHTNNRSTTQKGSRSNTRSLIQTAGAATPTTAVPQPSTPAAVGVTPKALTDTTSTNATSTPVGSIADGTWRTIFEDNFDGNAVDETKWGIYEGEGNAGIGTRERSAVTVADGELRIHGNNWAAGGLGTSVAPTYGLFEVRARLDKGDGYNTAVLLWPQSERWPVDGEIDISEIFDSYDGQKMGSFVHWGSDNQQDHHIESADFSQWHTYGVDWQPDRLTFYLDGRQIWTVTNPDAIPHTPHFLAIQLDVSKYQTKTPTTFHIDWARISQR